MKKDCKVKILRQKFFLINLFANSAKSSASATGTEVTEVQFT
jgi:hypothetical protein